MKSGEPAGRPPVGRTGQAGGVAGLGLVVLAERVVSLSESACVILGGVCLGIKI